MSKNKEHRQSPALVRSSLEKAIKYDRIVTITSVVETNRTQTDVIRLRPSNLDATLFRGVTVAGFTIGREHLVPLRDIVSVSVEIKL